MGKAVGKNYGISISEIFSICREDLLLTDSESPVCIGVAGKIVYR